MFDFKCPHCGKVLEKLVKFTEVQNQTCPDCGITLERQHTVGSLKFLFNYLADE
jgi:putative FmdB family regulatory protein